MPFEYLESIPGADEAFRAWGTDLGQTFSAAWQAVHGVLVDAEAEDARTADQRRAPPPRTAATPRQRVVSLSASELDLLLVDFLQEQLYLKDSEQVLYQVRRVHVRRDGTGWSVDAELVGAPMDTAGTPGVDVKAITLDNLRVHQTARGWEATVVLDL
ncbi:MAG: archease [Spirochaetaceae bacterium]|nr:MAG: archease [Spirochaetaceae bacterium]